jgi:hypothetical protein
MPTPASGQIVPRGGLGVTVAPAVAPRTFGPASEVAHVITAWEFQQDRPGAVTDYDLTTGLQRFCSAGECEQVAGVRLPAGALVSRIELDGCDDSGTGEITFSLVRTAVGNAPPFTLANFLALETTGVTETPGCGTFTGNLSTPTTIDNANFNYVVTVDPRGTTAETRFAAVRVFYTLQVSPAPGAASFTDVPISHPFFKFIEALAASGITAGCGGGNYCPDDPLTRGQMAVFLSKGLGLHFAP